MQIALLSATIRVIYCDAAVQGVEEFGASEPIELSPKGWGGTDFVPPFKWVEENGIEPKCLIDSRKSAPFGETLQIAIGS